MESKDITIEWRDCYIYGERYEVSNSGFVRNKKTNRILRQQVDKKGYMRVRLCLNCVKVTAKVHRLVAIAFLSNPNMKPQVNHIDTNKKNNCVSNLEWATNSENQLHAYRNGLKKIHGGGMKKIPAYKVDLNTGEVLGTYESITDAATKNGIHRTNICKVIRGKRKSTGGFMWITCIG